MAIICGSLNLLVFIKISSIIKPEKILLLKPINWRGDYPVTDCISYLLDAKSSVESLGAIASPFKQKLAEIAAKLEPLTAFNEIIEMNFEIPPHGYLAKGPFRYAFSIAPSGVDGG